jgi:hypothetical protein
MPLFKKYFTGTSVSRDLAPGEYSWDMVVAQSGRPILDAELNLSQDAQEYNRALLSSQGLPSGFLKSPGPTDTFSEYRFTVSGETNQFGLLRQFALVAGMPVVVDLTGSTAGNFNLVQLPGPTTHGGPGDVRRTDFVFLEVWKALVSPSPRAYGTVTINNPQTIANGDTITVNATAVGGPTVTFTARTSPSLATEFLIGAGSANTASALASAINNPANGLYPSYVASRTNGTPTVTITATFGGTTGNSITLATSASSHITLSGGTLTNGANRPNKPSQNAIYHHGNVLSLTGSNLADDLIDPVLNTETAQRVQIQYRLRTYSSQASGVNPKTQPDGFSNTNILAQGGTTAPVSSYPFVRADGASTSGSSSAGAYGFVDPGLFIAGDGSSGASTALGTVDGFVYAIPVCMVFRRNDATGSNGWDPFDNANGALPVGHANNYPNGNLPGGPYLIPTGASDRPDGLFADVVVSTDVLDLRRHISLAGLDLESELKGQLQALLDKKLSTWSVSGSDFGMIGNGTGDISTFPLVCDEIGREGANGGVSPSSGDTTVGQTVRNFDHIARRFAAQSVVETTVFEVYPAGPYPTGLSVTKAGGTVQWHEGDEISIDFGALNPTTRQNWGTPSVSGVAVDAFWPSGTLVTGIKSVWHDDGHTVTPVDQNTQLRVVSGVGTSLLTLTLDGNLQTVNGGGTVSDHPLVDVGASDSGSLRRIFVEVEITYPTGFGLTKTPDLVVAPTAGTGYPGFDLGGALVENDRTQRPTEMHSTWVPKPRFREGFREVVLEQRSAPGGSVVTDTLVTRNANTVYTPRRVATSTGLTANGGAATATLGSSERRVTLTGVPTTNQTQVTVAYYPQDPIPNSGASGYQVGVYYRTQAPQTCGVQSGSIPTNLLPTELTLEPLCISDQLWTGQTGKGSTELGFPYASPLDQIACATDLPVTSTPKEWYFSGLAETSVSDFDAKTGLLTLHSFVQVDGASSITLGSSTLGRGTQTDPEFRAYYDYANYQGYKPTGMAQPLSGPTRHKSFVPMLARSTQDTRLFRKGEILLVVFSRFSDLDSKNSVGFTDTPHIRTGAAVYRTRNLLVG